MIYVAMSDGGVVAAFHDKEVAEEAVAFYSQSEETWIEEIELRHRGPKRGHSMYRATYHFASEELSLLVIPHTVAESPLNSPWNDGSKPKYMEHCFSTDSPERAKLIAEHAVYLFTNGSIPLTQKCSKWFERKWYMRDDKLEVVE